MDLKSQKEQLIKLNQYTDKAQKDIARKFGELLSYPKWKIDELIDSNRASQNNDSIRSQY